VTMITLAQMTFAILISAVLMTIVIFLHAKWTTQEQSKDLENPDLEGLKNVLSTSKENYDG